MKSATIVLIVFLSSLFVPSLGRQTIPEIAYVQQGDRSLIFVNNPEQIFPVDLADKNQGRKTILTVNVGNGKYRDFYEHLNRTGARLGHGVEIVNRRATPITVTVQGEGFEASINGGRPFSQMFNRYAEPGTPVRIEPGGRTFIQRKDDSTANNSFFSGVIDFEISGEAGPGEKNVTVNNIAYAAFANIDPEATYMGYVQRIEPDGTNEARVYKGISPFDEVMAANVDFTIDDATGVGPLPVTHRAFNLRSRLFGAVRTRPAGWIANIGPANNAQAVVSDMVAFDMPGWGMVQPAKPSDGTRRYPNLGNWGPIYRLQGKITNSGTRARTVSVSVQSNPVSGACLATRANDEPWRDARINAGTTHKYAVFTVPPGQTVAYRAAFVLGGPSGGNLTHAVSLDD